MSKTKIRFTKLAMGPDEENNGYPGEVKYVDSKYADQLFQDRAAVPVDSRTYKAEALKGVETAAAPEVKIERRANKNQA